MSQAPENPQGRVPEQTLPPQNQIINDLAPKEQSSPTPGIVNDLKPQPPTPQPTPRRPLPQTNSNDSAPPTTSPGIINDLPPRDPAPSNQPNTSTEMPSSYLDPDLVNDLAPRETPQPRPEPKPQSVPPQPAPQSSTPQTTTDRQPPRQAPPQSQPTPAKPSMPAPKVSTKKPIRDTAPPPPTQQPSTPQTSAPKASAKKPIGDTETNAPTKSRKLVMKPGATMPAPQTPTETNPTPPDTSKEQQVWTGKYCGRCLIPSFLVCAAVTAGAVWAAFQIVPADLLPWTLAGLAASIWSLQLIRWSYRVLAYRYGLTTTRIYESRGWLYGKPKQILLPHVARVRFQRGVLEYLFGVGKIIVEPTPAGGQELLILESVVSPKAVVDQFEKCVASAKPD